MPTDARQRVFPHFEQTDQQAQARFAECELDEALNARRFLHALNGEAKGREGLELSDRTAT